MKKGLGIGFRNKKFGKEPMLERFVVQIVVVCGVIWGGGGFTLGDQTSECVKGYGCFMFLNRGACQQKKKVAIVNPGKKEEGFWLWGF